MKIAIAGTGYVDMSNGVLLSQHHEAVALDILAEKVAMINRKQSPIVDSELEDYIKNKPLNSRATLDKSDAYIGADFVIIATPTDCDPETNYFHSKVINDLQAFKAKPDIIVANHLADELADVSDKIFTRDLFGSD